MLRPALLQSMRHASRILTRMPQPTARVVVPPRQRLTQIALARRFQAIRCYSAPAGLSKEEVQGRIMDLLKGFDKVGFYISLQQVVLANMNQVQDATKV
jgi:NADH dehydrogenase (ubiquinone) 1 alpha/beta subcomplex 1, acyl-carrier protein